MQMELLSKLFFATLITWSYAANETGITTLTDYDCGCPGQNASYICTAAGGVITVWGGTAFNCPDRNEISLRHNSFSSASGECNFGAIVGYSVTNVDDCYTSRLDVTLSADLQGRTITCSVDDGTGVTPLGMETLIVSTPSVPPPPPQRITTLIANNPRELIFRWDQVDSNDYNCSTLQYDFTSENCGSCAVVAPQVVSCNGFQTSSAGITCTFTVWSIVCGNVTGPSSMESIDVNLKVPDAPTVQSVPRYLDARTKILIGLMTTFRTVGTSFIYSGIDGSVKNYTVTYFDITFGSSCGIANIPASSCLGGTCTHNFDILENSLCPPSTAIIVSVVASNVLGSSTPSTPLLREGLNNLVNVNFDPSRRSITCTFLNQPSNIVKRCSANITYGENCESFLNTFSGMGTGDMVETQELDTVPGVVEYCFLVTAESNNVTVLVDGTLQNIDSQANDMTAIIVVPLVFSLALLVLIVLVVLIPIAAVKYSVPKSTVCITFSVKDEAGSLAKALKVFNDCKVNILGLNTHLHHADFDRNAGNGYKFNYIHCMCKNEDKEFLKDKLQAEFQIESDDQEDAAENKALPVTAIIKVKDSPGALWKAIQKIGDHGINIVGVNTLSDRESIPGYKDNYVRCCSSEGSLQKVHTELKRITGKEVKIEFLDDEHNKKEKAIEYWVKDEVGALARTLQVVSDMGINISGVNLDHLPADIRRTIRDGGFKINFIECTIEKNAKKSFFDKLKREYGAVDAGDHEVSPDKLDEDPNYTIVKVTNQNEAGSLNKILKAFRDQKLNIKGVNILDTVFKREKDINYKHYHLEITATNDQETNLKKRLLAGGLAIDIKPFDLDEYQQPDHANDAQNFLQSHCESEESDSTAETDDSPTTRMIQFYVRDEVGALANALQIFSELAINITKVNPAHLSQEHQDEFVACSCAKDQRESLIDKLKSFGATKAEFLPEKEVQQGKVNADANYCVVKFSVPKVGSIVKVLKAFEVPDMGVKIFKVNPRHIKVHNQYVECCCTEEEKTKLLRKLEKIPGVTHVSLEPESTVSERPTQDPNYRIIKYSIGDSAGILVKALKVFFDLNLNIIGVNTLNHAFDRKATFKYKNNHVVFVATDEQEEKLKRELLVTGLAIDVKPYKRIWRSNNIEPLQPGNKDRNDIALTSIRVQND